MRRNWRGRCEGQRGDAPRTEPVEGHSPETRGTWAIPASLPGHVMKGQPDGQRGSRQPGSPIAQTQPDRDQSCSWGRIHCHPCPQVWPCPHSHPGHPFHSTWASARTLALSPPSQSSCGPTACGHQGGRAIGRTGWSGQAGKVPSG